MKIPKIKNLYFTLVWWVASNVPGTLYLYGLHQAWL
jgi:hypothetical protein